MKDHKKEFEIHAESLSDDILENVSGGCGRLQQEWLNGDGSPLICEDVKMIHLNECEKPDTVPAP